MLQAFRNFFKSKIGIVVTLAFLALIAFAFASMDVSSSGMFGGISGGDRVAVVGDERIDASELSAAASNAVDQARQSDPTITMQSFIARDGLEQVLDQLLQRTALAEFARRHGMRAGNRLVDSEIVKIPAFRGADGNFDAEAFRAAIAQRGLSEATVREDLEMGLLARQVITPITFSPVIPNLAVRQYASLLRERRRGTIALLPSAAFAPTGDPTQAQLTKFYQDNRDNYIRPERRVIRYAAFGAEALSDLPAPTEAQIAARYERDRANYAASERRSFTQVIAPTQAAAQAILDEVRSGKTLAASASEKGLAAAAVGPWTRDELERSASAAVANAGFAAASGALAAPARGGLGWYVLRVEAIDRQPGQTLAQVRSAIAGELALEQRRAALDDLTARIEEEFESGLSLSEAAEEVGVEISSTAPAIATGQIYGRTGEFVPQVLARVLNVAFEMEEGEPQLAVVEAGNSYVMFDVADITPSAVAPLAEIRSDVVAAWRRDEGAKGARAAADRIMARLARGTDLAAAIAAERKNIPAPTAANFTRDQLAQQRDVPPSLALFFSMAEGTVKKLEGANDAGWYVVKLDDVEAGEVAADDPILQATLQQLGQVTSEEYVEQFVKAAQAEVGVERNDAAIEAVAATLTGNQLN